jgi:hypothetical protein
VVSEVVRDLAQPVYQGFPTDQRLFACVFAPHLVVAYPFGLCPSGYGTVDMVGMVVVCQPACASMLCCMMVPQEQDFWSIDMRFQE